jgi:hypothetical protein
MTDEPRRPAALIVSSCRWLSTAELAKAMAVAGFAVGILAPADHPIDAQAFAGRRMVFSSLRPAHSLIAAMSSFQPDCVVPADETALALLHRLHRGRPGFRDVIERSLGASEHYGKVMSRVALADFAQEEDVAVPMTVRLASRRDVAQAVVRTGLPAYVKLDASWGGAGVIRVETVEEGEAAFDRLRNSSSIPRMLWRAAAKRDAAQLPIRSIQRDISMQSAIAGVPANCAIAAWRGEILACIEAVALQTASPTGSATVIQVRRDHPMHETCRRLVKRLGLSGLIGFDFIIEEKTGRPVLLELNGRATQTCHLRLGQGEAPPDALLAALTGAALPSAWNDASLPVGDNEIIELFPQSRRGVEGPRNVAAAPAALKI